MILTIGMIVKNEEKYLERCLNGIKPILDNVDSELIITDTGSTDSTVDIAKRYTDKVLHFDWCDDFSAARNFGLEQARGEWFMFLDADDIFESCNGIIDFFRSGDYKKYNSAAYTSHNLTGSGNTFVDYRAPRLTKISPKTKFEGIVHEHLNTFGEPIKNIYDTAVHYGYLYINKEDRQRKFERNSKLLIKKLDANGDSDPIIYSELFETFMGHDRTKAMEYLDEGIRVCEEKKSFLITVMYSLKAFAFYADNNYDEALRICREYFEIDKSIKPGVTVLDMEIYAIKAASLYKIKKNREAYEAYKYFFVIFNEVRSGRMNTSDMYAAQFRMATEANYITLLCDFLQCGLFTKNEKNALIFISNYPPKEYLTSNELADEIVDIEIRLLSNSGFKQTESCRNGLNEYGRKIFERKIKQLKVSNDHVILSIGMIVKNEEMWLEKCLSAIKPILDNVNSELIITDTGSTDRTVEIAKKYTEKVLHFDWIDDFSAARNYGLKKARGEWFMMLDADDIFRSCDNIIEFFNSGEYKKYNAATYISRNIFKTENGDSYGDLLAPRMVKIHPKTQYENVVHESLNTFQPPYKNIQDIADHYGYYYESEEDKIKKFKRNSELLLKRFKTEKETPILYVQLYEAFMAIKEYDIALDYLNSGIDLCRKKNSIVLVALYFHKVSYYQTEKKFEEAILASDEYFKMNKAIRPYPLSTDGEIYAIKAMCLYELGRYSDAVDTFKQFFEIYKDIENGKLTTYDRYLYSAYMCNEINILPLFNNFIDSCIKSDRFNIADEWLSTYPIVNYFFETKKIYELVKYELAVLEYFDYKKISVYTIKLNEYAKKTMIDELFYKLLDGNKRDIIVEALSELAKNDDKVNLKLLIYKDYLSGNDFSIRLGIYVQAYGINDDVDLIFLAIKQKRDISTLLCSSGVDLKKCAYLCCKNIDGFYEAAENYPVNCIKDVQRVDNIVQFYEYCITMRLIDNEDKNYEEKQNLIAGLYKIKNEIIARKNDKLSEFEKLTVAIKNNIRKYIKNGDIDSARKNLDEYRKINPNDSDIPSIEYQINIYK